MKTPRVLYHGTSLTAWESIKEQGLRPRRRKRSRWPKHPSRADAVYLTDSAWALHFARAASDDASEALVMVELDLDVLDKTRLMPDEDWLEQESRGHDGICPLKNIKERTRYFRDSLHDFAWLWRNSVDRMGTCCYRGVIPPAAFCRAVAVPPTHPVMMWHVDPIITMLNHQIMGDFYRDLARWFLGEDVTPTVHGLISHPLSPSDRDGLVPLLEVAPCGPSQKTR